MLVTLQEIIGMAEAGNYCVPAFNVYNIETVMGNQSGRRTKSTCDYTGISKTFK